MFDLKSEVVTDRYYKENSVIPYDENGFCELKGHRNFAEDEIPPHCLQGGPNGNLKSRSPISRVLNAFLNSGHGGTIFVGILNSKEVKGIVLNLFQQVHVLVALEDLMKRFSPPVLAHQCSVKFVPVVPEDASGSDVLRIMKSQPSISPGQISHGFPQQKHVLRTDDLCWCDVLNRQANNRKILKYVIEIYVAEWDSSDPRNVQGVGEMRARPMYEDEKNRVYFRRAACCLQASVREIIEHSSETVSLFYEEKISLVKKESLNLLDALLEEAEKKDEVQAEKKTKKKKKKEDFGCRECSKSGVDECLKSGVDKLLPQSFLAEHVAQAPVVVGCKEKNDPFCDCDECSDLCRRCEVNSSRKSQVKHLRSEDDDDEEDGSVLIVDRNRRSRKKNLKKPLQMSLCLTPWDLKFE